MILKWLLSYPEAPEATLSVDEARAAGAANTAIGSAETCEKKHKC